MVLFAEKGYAGMSMRHLAQQLEMSVASIYHHFPDKKALYLETVRFAFAGKELVFETVWAASCPPTEKLGNFIRSILEMMSQDLNFNRLIQREIMEADSERMQLLAQGVFKRQFCLLMQLAEELAPKKDAYLVATSIIGLVKSYIDYRPLHCYFPNWRPEHDQPAVIAAHVTSLLLQGLVHEGG